MSPPSPFSDFGADVDLARLKFFFEKKKHGIEKGGLSCVSSHLNVMVCARGGLMAGCLTKLAYVSTIMSLDFEIVGILT